MDATDGFLQPAYTHLQIIAILWQHTSTPTGMYPVTAVPHKNQGATLFANHTKKLAELHPPRAVTEVLRINVIDTAELGLGHSQVLDDLNDFVRIETENWPEVTLTLIMPPSTPTHGHGFRHGELQFKQLVKDAFEAVKTKFAEPVNNTVVQSTSFILDEGTCSSKTRDLSGNFLFIMSNEKDTEGNYKSHWARSFVFKRGCIPEILQTFPRRSCTVTTKELTAASSCDVSDEVALSSMISIVATSWAAIVFLLKLWLWLLWLAVVAVSLVGSTWLFRISSIIVVVVDGVVLVT